MALRRRRSKLKEWLSGLFPPKGDIHYLPDGPQRHAVSGGFISHAQDFALHHNTMTAVQGDQYTVTYVQGDRNLVPQIMKLLSDHIILGAAHDDSARVPPPRCHPGTRINLIARITAWFNGETQPEVLLWITGPAGVGKSAVVQTFAEYLFKSKLLGASVFCSRPNKRNNPHRVFITIAYQLAIRIQAYREFVVERLSLDPQLLNRDMATQFEKFIIEPFVEKKIGAGGKRFGILLDGLDELEGENAQCEIIQLISTFAHEHRDAPLVWIIASRPESHICNTFEDDETRQSHWSEYIPIDSTEACGDVERYMRASFKAVQKKYRHSISSDWPSDTDFLKLTAAASGLFIYAEVVMQFIKDPDHADPVSRLELVSSVIDRSNVISVQDNPFVHLDALYNEILSSIPPTHWPTAKQLLRFAIYRGQIRLRSDSEPTFIPQSFQTLRGMSILFGITRHTIYACINKCRSTLKIPDWKIAHKERLMFLHASFADYLKDSNRSGVFHVGSAEDTQGEVVSSVLEVWDKCGGDDTAQASVKLTWHQYCSKWNDKAPSRSITTFQEEFLTDVARCLRHMIFAILDKPAESFIPARVHEINMIKLSHCFDALGFLDFVGTVEKANVNDTNLLQNISLKDLKLGHLDWKDMSPAYARYGRVHKLSPNLRWILQRPSSSAELKAFVSELESLPAHTAVIVGSVSEGRVAAFCHPLKDDPQTFNDFLYYIIPYPE